MEKVILYGNGSVARMTWLALKHDSPYEVAAFTVDRAFIDQPTLLDLPVVPFEDVLNLYPPDEYRMMVAVGYVRGNQTRAEKYYQVKDMGYQLISYVSSQALVAPEVTIGENSVIAANSIISGFVKIGDNVRIGVGSYIGHDSVVHDHCFISDYVVVGGTVTIEPYCFVGLNATLRNRIKIARQCYIGAGSVILQDTKEKQVYMARPAELLPISSDELPLV